MATGIINGSYCEFVNTEINHDLNPPVKMETQRNQNFKRISRSYLNVGPYGCNGFLGDSTEVLDDSRIVEKILGHSIEDIRSTSNIQAISISKLNTEIGIRPLVKIDNNRTESQFANATLKKYNKPYNNTLFNLFETDHTDLFFIIDTGDNFIQVLKGLNPDGPRSRNLHIIHSVLTLADSAPKTKPDSKNYKNNNEKVHLYSWYYKQPITIFENDSLFISSFRVENKIQGIGWQIQQNWTLSGRGNVYFTLDAKKNNTKPLVQTYLSKYLTSAITNGNDDTTLATSLNMQKKRSGDYFQIWIAKEFPKRMSENNGNGVDDLVYVRGPNKLKPPKDSDSEYYRKRTYFVTGDWPAFSYSIYNKVNTIMIFKHPRDVSQSCVIRVYFPPA